MPPGSNESDLEKIGGAVKPRKIDESAAKLSQELAREQDSRKEERFYWIGVTLILLDVIVAPNLGWLFAPIFLFQMALYLSISRSLGVEHLSVPLERIFDKYLSKD